MASLKDTFSTIGGWFGDFVSLGLSLAMVFLVVDALFGVGTTGLVDNVEEMVVVQDLAEIQTVVLGKYEPRDTLVDHPHAA